MVRTLFLLLSFFVGMGLRAQTEITGTVSDAATGVPVEGASVVLLRNGNPLKFTHSNAKGAFSLNVGRLQRTDSLNLSCLNYAQCRLGVNETGPMKIRLKAEPLILNEVNVRGNRTIGKADTTVYDLTRFASERDNSLKDVLRKLPGVEIADNGQIEVNGKPLSRFTVEGLDMTGGRYNQLEEHIKAADVKKAEVINHDQPIKALQDKIFTDDIAMNIIMKDEARDKLLITLKPYLLIGETNTVGGSANALQVGKKRQLSYDAAYDRSGKDLTQLSSKLSTHNVGLAGALLPSWIDLPTLTAPIDAERLRLNTSQHYAVNRMQKSDDEHELRLSANYLRTVERQDTKNESTYDLGGITPETTSQQQHLQLLNDHLGLELERKSNTPTVYGNSLLSVNFQRTDALSLLADTLTQSAKRPQIDVVGKLYRLITIGKNQLTLNAVADYHYSEDRLRLSGESGSVWTENLRNNLWHSAASIVWLRKHAFQTYRLTALGEARNLNIVGNNTLLAASLTPYWQYKKAPWLTVLSAKARWERYPQQGKNFLLWNVRTYIRWSAQRRSEWSASASYNETTGSAAEYALKNIRSNYRTFYSSDGTIPHNRAFYTSFQYIYKRPIEELFLNASLNTGRFWRDMTQSLEIRNGIYYSVLTHRSSQVSFAQAEGNLSKGFFTLNLKTRLAGSISYNKGEQLSASQLIDYQTMVYRLSPNIEFSPAWGALSYSADFLWQHNKHLTTLFDWKQTLSMTSTLGPIDITVAATHYHNELTSQKVQNSLIADAKAVWRMKKARVCLSLSNLFNKQEYIVTQYSGVSSSTDHYQLRVRELVATLQFNL